MGFLNKDTLVVDAILTKKGRELLAKGEDQFKITQFALGDDEIDYLLWNPAHPQGTDSYGEAIDNLPMVEANPDETQIMRYKLVTLPKSTAKMPMITIVGGPFKFVNPGDTIPFEDSYIEFQTQDFDQYLPSCYYNYFVAQTSIAM